MSTEGTNSEKEFGGDRPSNALRFELFGHLRKNVAGVGLSILALILLFKYNPGYKWLIQTNLLGNIQHTRTIKDLTPNQRQYERMGVNYGFLDFIKQRTPENAIILFPPDSIIYPAQTEADFDPNLDLKSYVTYFLYPRKVVYEREKSTNVYYQKITHIAVINQWGYHFLPAEPEEKLSHTLISLKPRVD